jgi:hypothetical protein
MDIYVAENLDAVKIKPCNDIISLTMAAPNPFYIRTF